MLKLRFLMNSSCEEVLGFKTCCGLQVFDQNLEIHVENCGNTPIILTGRLDLETKQGPRRIDNLMPGGEQTIAPGELKAFYCAMDESLWADSKTACVHDTQGRRYEQKL